jgi:hypothetical protein
MEEVSDLLFARYLAVISRASDFRQSDTTDNLRTVFLPEGLDCFRWLVLTFVIACPVCSQQSRCRQPHAFGFTGSFSLINRETVDLEILRVDWNSLLRVTDYLDIGPSGPNLGTPAYFDFNCVVGCRAKGFCATSFSRLRCANMDILGELIARLFISAGDAIHIHPILLFALLCVVIAVGRRYVR